MEKTTKVGGLLTNGCHVAAIQCDYARIQRLLCFRLPALHGRRAAPSPSAGVAAGAGLPATGSPAAQAHVCVALHQPLLPFSRSQPSQGGRARVVCVCVGIVMALSEFFLVMTLLRPAVYLLYCTAA